MLSACDSGALFVCSTIWDSKLKGGGMGMRGGEGEKIVKCFKVCADFIDELLACACHRMVIPHLARRIKGRLGE